MTTKTQASAVVGLTLLIGAAVPMVNRAQERGTPRGEWRYQSGDASGTRYSPLDQIDASNFEKLRVAWIFRGDNFGPAPYTNSRSTPSYINGMLYTVAGQRRTVVAMDPKTGEVLGKTAERHTSAEFVAFLTDIVVNQPRGKEIHVIADNLSAHKTKRVDDFLAAHTNVHLHFTPTYSSWLNQVELWFAKIERDVIARGVFTSVPDLKRKLMRYIRQYNKDAKPVKWKYFDLARRITPASIVTVH